MCSEPPSSIFFSYANIICSLRLHQQWLSQYERVTAICLPKEEKTRTIEFRIYGKDEKIERVSIPTVRIGLAIPKLLGEDFSRSRRSNKDAPTRTRPMAKAKKADVASAFEDEDETCNEWMHEQIFRRFEAHMID